MSVIFMIGSFGNTKAATIISKAIIKNKLAACIYIQEVTSFAHKGKGKETLGIIKTNQKNTKEILKLVNNYKVPELVSFKATGGWKPYLKYLNSL